MDNTYPASADSQASWLKKGGKDPYSYKKSSATDQEGLVLGVVTTAHTNEVSNLEEVFDSANLPERIPVKADKGYPSQKNAELLKKRTLKKHLLKKAKKNKPLTQPEKMVNKRIGQRRFMGARTFGGLKREIAGSKKCIL